MAKTAEERRQLRVTKREEKRRIRALTPEERRALEVRKRAAEARRHGAS